MTSAIAQQSGDSWQHAPGEGGGVLTSPRADPLLGTLRCQEECHIRIAPRLADPALHANTARGQTRTAMSLAAASVPLLDKAVHDGIDGQQTRRCARFTCIAVCAVAAHTLPPCRVSRRAVLFELRCVHPFLYAGAGLLACAATVTCFALGALCGTAMRSHAAGVPAADIWASAQLRIASLLVNSLTAALVLLLLRSHLATCVVKPQLSVALAVATASTVAALCYISVFVARAVGTGAQADVADITSTIGMAAYTLMV